MRNHKLRNANVIFFRGNCKAKSVERYAFSIADIEF